MIGRIVSARQNGMRFWERQEKHTVFTHESSYCFSAS